LDRVFIAQGRQCDSGGSLKHRRHAGAIEKALIGVIPLGRPGLPAGIIVA